MSSIKQVPRFAWSPTILAMLHTPIATFTSLTDASSKNRWNWLPSYRLALMLISLRDLERSYPQGVARSYVLRRITLDIQPGEFVSIMGPSGAGKSTLLHILGMHDADWSGEYTFLGTRVDRLKPKDRAELHKRHIGFVFQSYHLLDNLTVYENLEVPLS